MKKSFIAVTIAAASFGAFANNAQKVMDNIDTSKWTVNPEDYGMTVQEYLHAEHNLFANDFISRVGSVNKLHHFTELATADDKFVVSPSLDHLYSLGAIDAREGFTVVIPENADGRFISLHIQDENHTFVAYEVGAGTYTFSADDIDTDTVLIGIRAATDGTPANLKYLAEVIQPQYKIIAGSAINDFPKVDRDALLKVRDALQTEYVKLDNTFGTVTYNINDVSDWEKTLYTISGAWGLSPEDTAMYPAYALEGAKGDQCYTATYDVPPVAHEQGYYSITVYGDDGYLMSDNNNIVSSNQGIILNEGGETFTVNYGSQECEVEGQNFAYTPSNDWQFLMRVYLPNVEAMYEYVMPEITEVK